MKVKMLTTVIDVSTKRKEGEVYDLKDDTAKQYIGVGIAVLHRETKKAEVKESKEVAETKEDKQPLKRTTKARRNVRSKNK